MQFSNYQPSFVRHIDLLNAYNQSLLKYVWSIGLQRVSEQNPVNFPEHKTQSRLTSCQPLYHWQTTEG